MRTRRTHHLIVLATAAAAAVAASCASRKDAWGGSPDRMPRTTVAVRNNAPEDMAILAVNAIGTHARLGTVMRSAKRDLVIPPALLSRWGVQLLVEPVGSNSARAVSCPEIWPGSTIDLVLERDPVANSCSLR